MNDKGHTNSCGFLTKTKKTLYKWYISERLLTLLCIFLWLHQHSSSGWCIDCRQMGTIQPQHQQEYQHQQHKENNIQPQQLLFVCCIPSKSKEMLNWIRSLNCFWTLHLPTESPITAHRVATWWKISRKFFKMAPYLPLLPPLPLPTPRPLWPHPPSPAYLFLSVCPSPLWTILQVADTSRPWIVVQLPPTPPSPKPSPPPQRGLGAMPSRARQAHRANAMQCNSHRHTGRPRIAAAVHSTEADVSAVSCTLHEVMRVPLSCTLPRSWVEASFKQLCRMTSCAEKAQSAKQIAHFLQSVCWCVIRRIGLYNHQK